jgi:tetratricopeptide (TPR) repeat protein
VGGKKKSFQYVLFLIILFISIAGTNYSQGSNPNETLSQYITDLQKNPNDNALREKIIKLALTLNPSPAVPEEAERFMARGIAAIKGAKGPSDFADAVAEFQKAALAAPWLANVYNNLGIAQDKAGQYAEAISSLKLYLLAAPFANDADEVKSLIYEIEYRQEKAAKEFSEEELKKEDEYGEQERYSWLLGLWNYRSEVNEPGYTSAVFQGVVEFSRVGDIFEGDDQKELNPQEGPLYKVEISGNDLRWERRVYDQRVDKMIWIPISVLVRNDQKTITYSFSWTSGTAIQKVTLNKE